MTAGQNRTIQLKIVPSSRLDDWRVRAAARLLPAGWCLCPQPSPEQLAEDAAAQIKQVRAQVLMPPVRQGSSLHVGACPRSNPDPDLPRSVRCKCKEATR